MKNARPTSEPPDSASMIEPRRAGVWIHIDGTWHLGCLGGWYQNGAEWICEVQYEGPKARGWRFGFFVYTPETILSRHEHPRPPDGDPILIETLFGHRAADTYIQRA